MDDERYLRRAVEIAEQSLADGHHPIGALIVNEAGEILAESANEIISQNDPTAHAEVCCMRKVGKQALNKETEVKHYLYTNLEPCYGCAFFITRTNIARVVWALNDPYKGGVESLAGEKKLLDEMDSVEFVAEPFPELRERSRQALRQYYLNKGREEVVRLFE